MTLGVKPVDHGADDGDGRAAVEALLEEAARIAGTRGLPLHLLVLRLERERREDVLAMACLDAAPSAGGCS